MFNVALVVTGLGWAASLAGCASVREARQKHWLSDARQIVSAREQALREAPEAEVPTLDEIVDAHPVLTADRAAVFIVTDYWALPKAANEVVLEQRQAVRGQRVVASGAGEAWIQDERRR